MVFRQTLKRRMDMDILSLTAVELAKAIREGRTTAVEATQAVLDRIAVRIPTTAM